MQRKILLLGPPGTGKTTFAARYRPKAKKLILDVDEKFASQENIEPSIRSHIDVWTPGETLSGPRIGIARVERFEQKGRDRVKVPGTEGSVPQNPQGFIKTVNEINALLDQKDYPYEVTVFDGFTKIAEHLDRLVKYHHQTASFSMPLWGVFGTNLQELLSGFLALPGDKIVICHSKIVQDEETSAVYARALIPGFMADALPKEFNEVYYCMGESRGKFIARTRANSKYVARTCKSFAPEEPIESILEVLNK